MAKIIHLRLTDIGGLAHADANLNGKSAVIGGKNRQGKTSLQRAIKMILGGKEHTPSEPVRRGADKGTGHLELDNGWIVDYTITPDRKAKLKIAHRDNPLMASTSVDLLKGLFGPLSFDPSEFLDAPKAAKIEQLLKLTGLDFSALNVKRKAAYDERTLVGRELTRLAGQLSGMPFDPAAPSEEVQAGDLVNEKVAAKLARDTWEKERVQQRAMVTKTKELAGAIERIGLDIESLRRQLEAKITLLAETKDLLEKTTADAASLEDRLKKTVLPDMLSIDARIDAVDATNRTVRANAARQKFAETVSEKERARESLTASIDEIDAEKRDALSGAKLPVDGLEFDETDLRFNGTPWDAISESEQAEVATAVAFALNPKGVVFMAESGGMDCETRRRVVARAQELDVQLLLEVCDDQDDVSILIEAGEIKENRLEAAK